MGPWEDNIRDTIFKLQPRFRVCTCDNVDDDPAFAAWFDAHRHRLCCKLDQLIGALVSVYKPDGLSHILSRIEFVEMNLVDRIVSPPGSACTVISHQPVCFHLSDSGLFALSKRDSYYFVDRSCHASFPATVDELDQILHGFRVSVPGDILAIVLAFAESYQIRQQPTRLIDWFLPEFQPLIDLSHRAKLRAPPSSD